MVLLSVVPAPSHQHRGVCPGDCYRLDGSRLDLGDMELESCRHRDEVACVAAPTGGTHLVDREPERGAALRASPVCALDVPSDEVVAPVLAHRPLVPGSDEQPALSHALDIDDDGAVVLV